MITSKSRPKDGTHAQKYVVIDRKLRLLKIVPHRQENNIICIDLQNRMQQNVSNKIFTY
jgi:hypothetical protein